MKDNLLEEGDEIIVSGSRYDVPRIRKVSRVTKTLAYAGDYTLRREVHSNNYVREVGKKSAWQRKGFRLGTPETLAAARAEAELADKQQAVREQLREAGSHLGVASLAALSALGEALAAFAPTTPIDTLAQTL